MLHLGLGAVLSAGVLSVAGLACGGDDPASAPTQAPTAAPTVEDRVIVLLVPGFDPDLAERWRGDLRELERLSPGRVLHRVAPGLPLAQDATVTAAATGIADGRHPVTGGATLDPATMALRGSRATLGTTVAANPPFWSRAAAAGIETRALWVPVGAEAPPAGLEVVPASSPPAGLLDTAVILTPGADAPAAAAVEHTVRLEGDPPWEVDLPVGPEQAWTLTVGAPTDSGVRLSAGSLRLDVRYDDLTAPVEVTLPDGPATVRLAARRLGDGVGIGVVAARPGPASQGFAGTWAARHDAFDPTGGVAGLQPLLAAGVVEPTRLARALQDELQAHGSALAAELDRRDRKLVVARLPQAAVAAEAFVGFSDPGHPGWDPELAARLGGELKATYAALDGIVGQVRGSLEGGDRLVMVSEYGVAPVRKHVDLNALLALGSRLAVASGVDRAATPALDEAVEWSKTKAYATGAGAVFLNRSGREAEGIVSEGALAGERARLAAWLGDRKDGKTGFIAEVVEIEEAGPGEPDLLVRFAEGYGPAPAMLAGRLGADVVTENRTARTGGPATSSAKESAGFAAASFADVPEGAALSDLGATVDVLVELDGATGGWFAPAPAEAPGDGAATEQ